MRLDVTFRNMKASDALRERAEMKFQKVAMHLKEPVEGRLIMLVDKHRHTAELTVHSAGEQTFTAKETTEDPYASIDTLMHRMERTARRAKERMLDRMHGRPTTEEED
jgi:putative sigma-54 modulation protein